VMGRWVKGMMSLLLVWGKWVDYSASRSFQVEIAFWNY
jgi:hypothetical protein